MSASPFFTRSERLAKDLAFMGATPAPRGIRQRWQAIFFAFVDKRSPKAASVVLNRKNLYTFPTRIGFAFCLLCLVLWAIGTNYQNNLILAFSYLLTSLVIVSVFHTFANMAGITISIRGAKPVFAGDNAYFTLEVSGVRAKGCDNIGFFGREAQKAHFNFKPNTTKQINVPLQAPKRGALRPGKLCVETTAPLGLIRCWTWQNLDASTLVFPKPLKSEQPLVDVDSESENIVDGVRRAGDDFSGLNEYRPGDNLKHIAWKHFAREQGLYIKEYDNAAAQDAWLQWDSFGHLEPEQRLSALCYWALKWHELNVPYGLKLPGKQLPPSVSDGHRLSVLSSLARFDITLSQG